MSSPGATTQPSPDPLIAAWQSVLTAQYAAIYGYGLLGVYLTDPAEVARARVIQQGHRDTRDVLLSFIASQKQIPAAPEATYSPAVRVTDAGTAQQLALQLEVLCAASYRYLLRASANPNLDRTLVSQARSQAMAGLTAAATTAAGWRAVLAPANPTVAFPGR